MTRAKAFLLVIIAHVAVFGVAACAGPAHSVHESAAKAAAAPAAPEPGETAGSPRLYAGDKVKIAVFGDEDLTGEYNIDGRGYLTMPLIGDIKAADMTAAEFQSSLETRFSEGFLVNPRVSVEIVSLRPFYIAGEVRNPGGYPSVPGLDAFKAIAIAGGHTPRAVKNRYIITRGEGANRRKIIADDDTTVLPGDAIKVEERFF